MLKSMKKTLAAIAAVFMLSCLFAFTASAATGTYSVKAGDTLWKIAQSNGLTVQDLKQYNSLTSDTIYVGQKLVLEPANKYTVKKGDTLWKIAQSNSTTVSAIKSLNNLTSDTIYINQVLLIPKSNKPAPVLNWPSITHVVKEGEYVSVLAKKYGVTQAQIMKYNYMDEGEWLDAGEKIAINGYAPRNWDVVPGESAAPARVGKYVDWYRDGQYLIKRNDVFTITDVKTGLSYKAKMLGGYNHVDIEPLTATDTAVMKKLFPTWNWTPRPVVIYHKGINFAASLSGMPHSFDSIPGNNVSGHFDVYLKNSTGHGENVSAAYAKQHADNIMIAAGLK